MHCRSFSYRRLWIDFGYCQMKKIIEVTLNLYVNNTNYGIRNYLHIFYIIMNSFTFSELREILVSVQSCIEVLAVKIQVRSWYLFSLFSSLSMIICLLVTNGWTVRSCSWYEWRMDILLGCILYIGVWHCSFWILTCHVPFFWGRDGVGICCAELIVSIMWISVVGCRMTYECKTRL